MQKNHVPQHSTMRDPKDSLSTAGGNIVKGHLVTLKSKDGEEKGMIPNLK